MGEALTLIESLPPRIRHEPEPKPEPAVLRVRLPQPASEASVTVPSKVLRRDFRGAYTCIATHQGVLFDKGALSGKKASGDLYHITIGGHSHIIEFTVTLDWSGSPDSVLIEDSSEAASDATLPIMNLMLAIQAIVQTRILADFRVAPYLNQLKIYVRSFITSVVYSDHDRYSVNSGFVPPCDALSTSGAARGAAEGFLLVLNDLVADIAFGDAHEQKGISFRFPTLPQPSQ